MKRFLVLEWDQYYPSDGLGNVAGSFDTLEKAKTFCNRERAYPSDYQEIYDQEIDRTVWER